MLFSSKNSNIPNLLMCIIQFQTLPEAQDWFSCELQRYGSICTVKTEETNSDPKLKHYHYSTFGLSNITIKRDPD